MTQSAQQQMNQIILLRLKKRINEEQRQYRDEIALQFTSRKQTIKQKLLIIDDQSDKIDDQIIKQFAMIDLQKKAPIPNFLLQRIDPSKYFAKKSENQPNQKGNNNQKHLSDAVNENIKTTDCEKDEKVSQGTPTFITKSRENIINSLRNIREQKIQNSRQKFKIINVESKSDQKYVDFGGVKYYYENLEASDIDEAYDYYVIRRNNFVENESKIDYRSMKTLYIPKQYEAMLDESDKYQLQNQGIMEQQDKQDSNREDRSDYEYPDQESSQRNSAYDNYEEQLPDWQKDSQDQDDFSDRNKNKNRKKKSTWRDDSFQYEDDHKSLDSDKLNNEYIQNCQNYEDQDAEMVECD